jgi:hypothetical protein
MEESKIRPMSIDAQVLYERLEKTQIGDRVSYKELNAIIDKNVQNGARHLLETARRAAMRKHHMVFQVIANEGLLRLDDLGIVATGKLSIAKVGRATRRGLKKLACVQNFDGMSNEAKIKHNTFASTLGALSLFTRGSSVKRIEEKVTEANVKLATRKTLEAFMK